MRYLPRTHLYVTSQGRFPKFGHALVKYHVLLDCRRDERIKE